ncbi:ATP-binding cassette domain-containing protein [Campylobacter sp. VBCF_01 NA2]|uniref:ATP-binding cassette domain-containing protein n=1 Tax=Campylobacter sp. VBCF_01 NA2 TaxID=2983836 RepID=UPI0022EA0868|nr:ATP-binding cassette domain-containing protein [Campylobacter sp. VBCF_01 NA2]WBR53746.1 ATP-binding cassette domain-containing protein [Campylobacter sp. VBCF_01 NA2]
MQIYADNCTLSYGKNPIVSKLSFRANSGEMVAVMGPSGVGKSTTLGLFFGEAKCENGEFGINGAPNLDQNIISLITQDDILIKEFSVYENLKHYARLHGVAFSRIDEVISSLNLGKVQNSPVYKGGKWAISGGQRKRVNIAMEMLLSRNEIFFADEPTSGLSTAGSIQVLQSLRDIADGKSMNAPKIVMVIIHQPNLEMIKMFDKILLFEEIKKENGKKPTSLATTKFMSLAEFFSEHLGCDYAGADTLELHKKYNEFLKSI